MTWEGAADNDGSEVGATETKGNHTHTVSVSDENSAHTHNISVQAQSGGGTETRPRNVALLACIKY